MFPSHHLASVLYTVSVCVTVTQSCLTLCDPVDCSPPGSSVHGVFQARVLEWVAIAFSRGSSRSRDQTQVSRIAGRCFTVGATRAVQSEVAQLRPTLCNPMEYSLPGSSVHGIFQAIVLEWGAIAFSRGSSRSRDWTQLSRIVDRHFTI